MLIAIRVSEANLSTDVDDPLVDRMSMHVSGLITLTPGQRNIHIHQTALHHRYGRRQRYRYPGR